MNARRPGRTPACRRCPHSRDNHAPYIPGGDKPGYCAACQCWGYQPERPWTRLLAWFRSRPAPVRAEVLRQHPVPYPVPECAEDDDDSTQFGVRVPPYAGPPRTRRERL